MCSLRRHVGTSNPTLELLPLLTNFACHTLVLSRRPGWRAYSSCTARCTPYISMPDMFLISWCVYPIILGLCMVFPVPAARITIETDVGTWYDDSWAISALAGQGLFSNIDIIVCSTHNTTQRAEIAAATWLRGQVAQSYAPVLGLGIDSAWPNGTEPLTAWAQPPMLPAWPGEVVAGGELMAKWESYLRAGTPEEPVWVLELAPPLTLAALIQRGTCASICDVRRALTHTVPHPTPACHPLDRPNHRPECPAGGHGWCAIPWI